MFDTNFLTAQRLQQQRQRENDRRQATARISRELRDQALAAAAKRPLLQQLTGWLRSKRASEEANDAHRAHAL